MKVPLTEIYVGDDVRQAVERVFRSGQFVKGPENGAFEREFARYVRTSYAQTVSSGTAALHVALQALGLGRNDEVLVPSFSFVATATPLLALGAKPVFVDIEPETYTMDPALARKKVTKRTRGMIPVHLYGHPADLGPLAELAEERGLWMLEDACQAHGARYFGKHVGAFGDAAAFSFYPSKSMTVLGDGGMVVTNRTDLAERLRMFADAGRGPGEKYVHRVVAENFRMSEVAAAIGRVQLAHLPHWVDARRTIAKEYTERLSQVPAVSPPRERRRCVHGYYVYTIRTKLRDALAKHLGNRGIATGLYYPLPIHRQPLMPASAHRLSLPETDRAAKEVLSLPIFPSLPLETAREIAESVASFHGG